ncbi:MULTISPECIES: hypothetical protein [Enterobacter cloacae complex]|uniref:hypothetical protein n=1 Tax=Enterobacter cloacae complex TaxID=354276 RepID=UPI00101198FF|nr:MULTISPECIES: hypothetical protein [Enterobacter cloacae complex]MDQ6584454.1 hypothetical protein [Enterobacter hormaechei]
MNKLLFLIAACASLSGCVSPEQRIAECQAKGVSYDTCYLVEQQKQMNAQNAAMNASQRALMEDDIKEALSKKR